MATDRIVIVGATSAIATHCARLWLSSARELFLVGRNELKLQQLADDLRVRNPAVRIAFSCVDFEQPEAIAACVDQCFPDECIDIALIAHGSLPEQSTCETDLAIAQQAMAINAVSPALFAEALGGRMAAAGGGTLAVIGSVAGDRGRKSNYVYGASKSLLESYCEGLRHRLFARGVKVCLIKPGPTATPMTAQLSPQAVGAMAAPEAVAACIVQGVERGRAVIYAPAKWRLIMWVIRQLPRAIFHRMDI